MTLLVLRIQHSGCRGDPYLQVVTGNPIKKTRRKPVRRTLPDGIILNGSPLSTGGAGGGESEIRRYLREHDLLEAIVALPTDMFYNTGIATCLDPVERRAA